MKETRTLRLILVFLTYFLAIFGIYMVYSASSIWAEFTYGDAFYYMKRQILFVILGSLAFMGTLMIPSSFLKKHALHFVLFTLILLILVLIPGLGITRNGSRSWFGVGSFALQPSELFKIAMVNYVSYRLSSHYEKSKYLKEAMGILLFMVAGFLLIMLQPDFGTGLVMVLSIVFLLFLSKLPIRYFVLLGVIGVASIVILILMAPYRFDRILSFFDPWQDPLGSGFQIIQSLYALGPGGLLGKGILGSYQKHFYLPEPQTDFIFAIVVEEFGLLGGLLIIAIFGALFYVGFRYALKMKDPYHTFLISGLLGLILIQVLINLGVVVALLPVTGITLPLLSYGGSSLSVSLLSLGLVVSRESKKEVKKV